MESISILIGVNGVQTADNITNYKGVNKSTNCKISR